MALILEIGFGIWVFLVAVIIAFMRGATVDTPPSWPAGAAQARDETLHASVETLRRRRG
jgi:hypothetical protein